VSHDFLDHFCRTVCRVSVTASDIAGQVGLNVITESKLEVVTAVSRLFWIVTFYCPLLMAFDICHTAVNIDGDGFELALSQEVSEEFEIDFSQHLGGLVAEVSQKPRYRFRFFDRNGKLVDQGIALQQFQPFQFVNSNEVTAGRGLDVVHFDFVGGCVLKNQVVINQVKNPIFTGMFE
jgi:hypothetical protein